MANLKDRFSWLQPIYTRVNFGIGVVLIVAYANLTSHYVTFGPLLCVPTRH